MPRPASDKRERLAAAAAELVAARGIEGATIAAIAERAGVAQGSVYYHLRSKDEIALAAVEALANARAAELEEWSGRPSPTARLDAYLSAATATAATVAQTGNAATLAVQLRATAPEAADAAARIVRDTIAWAAGQFEELGFASAAASARALHLVTGVEGAGQLAHALGDATPLERESAHLARWVANSRSSS
jgi:AcrR family transcriptional regulator